MPVCLAACGAKAAVGSEQGRFDLVAAVVIAPGNSRRAQILTDGGLTLGVKIGLLDLIALGVIEARHPGCAKAFALHGPPIGVEIGFDDLHPSARRRGIGDDAYRRDTDVAVACGGDLPVLGAASLSRGGAARPLREARRQLSFLFHDPKSLRGPMARRNRQSEN